MKREAADRARSAPRAAALVLAAAQVAAAGSARAVEPLAARSLSQREVTIAGDGSTGPYDLGARWILRGTDEVLRGERRLVRDLDYQLDDLRGRLTLTQPLLEGQTILARFEALPFRLAGEYARHVPALPDTAAAPGGAPVPPRPAAPRPGPAGSAAAPLAGLVVGGSKTVSFDLGTNRDLAVDQELQLSIAGRVAPEVEVRALLSDRNLPIQPEGTTRELDRLDQVRVEVIAPRAQLAMGDYEIAMGGGTAFAPFQRELQGVKARVGGERQSVSGGVAFAKGRFRRQEFMGEEGRQGPYALTDENGAAEIVVLAGSETVWLDGRELVRGEDADYVMDYSRGRVEFSRRNLVSADSRIAVDYEFANEAFQRDLVFLAGSRGAPGEAFEAGLLMLQERDDESRPRGLELTEEDLARLRAAGDQEVLAPGWSFAGPGEGDYVLDPPDSAGADSVLRYVGPNGGDVDARFTRVATGTGGYERLYDESAFQFYYRRREGGDYAAYVRLARPRRLEVADAYARLRPHRLITVSGEVAGSRLDRNTLSPLGDGDNDDRAVALSLGTEAVPLGAGGKGLGTLRVSGNLRDVGPNFAAPGADRPAFHAAAWSLQGGQADATAPARTGQERERELRAEYAPVAPLTVRGSLGDLWRPGSVRARRWEAGALSLWPPGGRIEATRARTTSERADTTGSADVARLAVERQLGAWSAQAAAVEDERLDAVAGAAARGFAYREGSGRLGRGDAGASGFALDGRWRRNREIRDGRWQGHSLAREGALSATWRRGRGQLQGRLARRDLDADPGAGGADTRSDLAELLLRDLLFADRFGSDVTYRITNTREEKQERRFLRTGPGADYDSLGNFTPGGGEFTPIRVSAGFEPVTAVEFSSRARWAPGRRALGGETFVEVEERSRGAGRTDLYLLRPGSLQGEATIFGRIGLRQDLLWEPAGAAWSARLRLAFRQELDERALNYELERKAREGELRLRASPAPGWTLEGRARREVRRASVLRGSPGAGASGGSEDLLLHDVSLQALRQARADFGFGLALTGLDARDDVSGRALRQLEIAPTANRSLRQEARVEARLLWRASEGAAGPALPVSGYGLVRRPGWEWRTSLDWRFGRSVQATLRYEGEKLLGRRVLHRGSTQMRAYF